MNKNWNISGLIIEGICGTGKTTLFEHLVQSERFYKRPFLSSILLSEHQTQRVLERKEREEGLTTEDNTRLLDQHVSYFESLRERLDLMRWCDNKRISMRIPFVLERFHFTHVYHYSHMDWSHVEQFDRRLAKLNCKLCVLTMDASVFHKRIVADRDTGWRNYLSRFGETEEEILEHYVKQQNLLYDLCKKSSLETLVINTTDAVQEEVLEKVLKFWGII